MTRPVSILATRQLIDLATSFDYPPMPTRSMDWSAINSRTFDADWDGERYVTRCPIGRGETEAEAIADLLEQLAGKG